MPSPIPVRQLSLATLAVLVTLGLVSYDTVPAALASLPGNSPGQYSTVDRATASSAPAVRGAEIYAAEEDDAPPIEEFPTLLVAPDTPVLEADEGEYGFSVLLTNPSEDPLPGGTIELEISSEPAGDMGELNAQAEDRGVVVGSADTGETPAGEQREVSIPVPAADLPLNEFSERGVYRVRALFMPDKQSQEDPDESTGSTSAESPEETPVPGSAEVLPEGAILEGYTPVVWRSAQLGALVPVTTVVPLVLPDVVHSLPTRDQLNTVVPRLDRLLTAAEETESTLAVDPRLIAGIRAYGDAAPAAAIEWLERLRTTPLPQFMLQFADADPAAQAALGFDELMQPREISFVTRFGEFPEAQDDTDDETGQPEEHTAAPGEGEPPAESPGAGESQDSAESSGEPNETPEPSATAEDAPEDAAGNPPDSEDGDNTNPWPAPTLDELLDWPVADWSSAWPAAGEVDSSTVDLLRASEIDSMVIDSTNVNYAGGPRVEISGMSTLVADTALGHAVRDAIGADTPTERAAGTAEATAQLVLAAQAESPGVAIALDRGAIAEAEQPEDVLTELSELPWVDHVGAAEQAEGSGSLRAGSTLESRRELLRTAVGREEMVTDLAPLLVRPEYLFGYQRARLLQLFATRYASPEVDFEAVSERFQDRDSELLDGVRVISSDETQLVGTSSRVPVQVRNALPFTAMVTGKAVPASAALRVPEQRIDVTEVPAEGNETVLVPVHTRVSAGASGLIVTLTDVTGEHSYFTGTLPITIRSAFERIALVTVGGLALALLGFGIWRSFRRKSAKPPQDY